MDFESMTPEQMEAARRCETPDELLALAREEGYELSSEELKAVVGGVDWWDECECKGTPGYDDHVECNSYRPFIP